MSHRLIVMFLCLVFFTSAGLSQSSFYDYLEEKVTFPSNEVTLAGTLTLPVSGQPAPVIVLITGGGNRNRDAQIGRFKPFKLIAAYLSQRGFAVLRFDDRGVGESTGINSLESNLDDFKDDALSAIAYLKSRDDIMHSRIGLLGHCAGAYACLKASFESKDVAFLTTMAGYGLDGVETLLDGKRRELMKAGEKQDHIQQTLGLHKQLFKAMMTHGDFVEVESKMRIERKRIFETLSDSRKSRYEDFDDYFRRSSDGWILEYAKTNYFLEVLKAKPIPYYEKLNIPALLMFGENDLDVHPDAHIQPIITALAKAGNKNYEIKIIPEADHYFVADWSSREFAPKFLPTLYDWLSENIQQSARIQK